MRLANPLPLTPKTADLLSCKSLFFRTLGIAALIFVTTSTAVAGGPRWFSGPPYFYTWYVKVAWYTNQPSYFTDPGDLSANVNHASADAIVAKAAGIWNIPTASLVLAQGGTLNEHVSGANITAGTSGLTFPTDVQTANYQAKQIAIIYDTDGSVTDALLGSGSSDPTGCLQNAVTESVDLISRDGHINHAMLILNGRCTGPEPEKQLEMQYQLERAFGRILGLGWSQTNDNVFTGSPAPSATQALNWPIMHPIDIICGPYTYQCLPQPFTLRPDDISSLEFLYFINPGQAGPGKQASWTSAGGVYGDVSFPNGQGMEGVNVVVRRRAPFWDTPEDWQTASAVSGYGFRGESSTPIAAPDTSLAGSVGVPGTDWEGRWRIQTIPVPPSQSWTDLVVSTEPINPLYTGPYAIGPQSGNTISPSGSPQVQVSQYLANGRDNGVGFVAQDAAPLCSSQTDGTQGAPSAVPQGGWWNGTLCGYLHQAWSSVPIAANRTLTIEVTALDEHGAVTMTKAMPAIGVWKSAEPTGTLPTVASAPKAFNSMTVGLTTLHVQSSSSSTSYRIAFADQRGAGRPDFAYQARVLYAASVAPATLSSDGGSITITGMGFRQGNIVLINGTAAVVTSSTANTIVATAPSLHTLGLGRQTVASITVQDPSTGGTSVMSAALTYTAPVESLQLMSAPAGTIPAGAAAPTAFSVKAIAPDGFTPIVGEAVSFSANGAAFSPCAASSCIVLTDASGIASATVTPTTQGLVRLAATGRSGSAGASFTASGGPDVLHLLSAPSGIATVGSLIGTPLLAQLLAFDGVTPHAGSAITLTVLSGAARLSGCPATPCVLSTDAQGTISTTITPTSAGAITVQLATTSTSVNSTFSAAAETIQLKSAPTDTQTIGIATSTPFQVKVLAGDGVTPVQGEAVVFTAAGGTVKFSTCGGAVCTLTTDAQGLAQSSVTPLSAGAITVSAIGNAGSVTSTFKAINPPDLFRTVSAPTGTVHLGDTAAALFSVRITAADGTTPVAGNPVTFTTASGAAIFGSCSAATCIALTDATGLASTSVSPTSPSQISIVATSEAGTLTSSFTAATRLRSITATKSVQYVAAGVTVSWTPQVTLSDSSASVSALGVTWSGSSGLAFATPSSGTSIAGIALGTATIGPLAGGQQAQGTACAWISVCSPLTAVGVAANDLRLSTISGANQSVSTPDTLTAVTLRVVDLNGNPVAGVPVRIDQTVTNWEASCSDIGRCPPASPLATSQAFAISDMGGLVTVQTAGIPGVPTITHLAAIAGTGGFATLSVEKHP